MQADGFDALDLRLYGGKCGGISRQCQSKKYPMIFIGDLIIVESGIFIEAGYPVSSKPSRRLYKSPLDGLGGQ